MLARFLDPMVSVDLYNRSILNSSERTSIHVNFNSKANTSISLEYYPHSIYVLQLN